MENDIKEGGSITHFIYVHDLSVKMFYFHGINLTFYIGQQLTVNWIKGLCPSNCK